MAAGVAVRDGVMWAAALRYGSTAGVDEGSEMASQVAYGPVWVTSTRVGILATVAPWIEAIRGETSSLRVVHSDLLRHASVIAT